MSCMVLLEGCYNSLAPMEIHLDSYKDRVRLYDRTLLFVTISVQAGHCSTPLGALPESPGITYNIFMANQRRSSSLENGLWQQDLVCTMYLIY
jgi:hypothetical protein